METPSSTRRVTRSQTQGSLMATNNIPTSNFEKGLSNSRTSARKGKQQQSQQQDRSVLFDITNDSPIVGLKTAILVTPLSSAVGKSSAAVKRTPGSGEALLRGQVKTLLQKVEEEAELSKLSSEARSFVHSMGMLVNSPAGLLAPTPANTPQVLSLSGGAANGVLASLPPSPLVEEMIISQVIEAKERLEGSLESQRSIITRSLLVDFSEKLDSCDSASDCLSVLTDLGIASGEENPSVDDDSASVWSVQVNASARSEEEVEEEEEHCYDNELAEQARRHTRFLYDSDDEIVKEEEEEEEDYYYEGVEEEEEEEEESEAVDELCEFIGKISMDEKKKKEFPKSEGKHVRFVYGRDGEILKQDPVLHLNGLPTPKGKHVRFSEE